MCSFYLWTFFCIVRVFISNRYIKMDKYTKGDIEKIVNDEIRNFIADSLDKEVKKILQNKNSQSRTELIKTIKDSMERVYKTLWQKREFWKTDIK